METGAAPIAEWSNAVTGYLSTNLMATGRMNMLESGMETGSASIAEWSNAVTGYIEWLFIKNSATHLMNMLESGMETETASMAEWSNAVTGYIEWLFINQSNRDTSVEYTRVRYRNRGCLHG